jgi:hypothetical protein
MDGVIGSDYSSYRHSIGVLLLVALQIFLAYKK